jgi:1,4-alpha-glucan branching enzyme
MAREHARDFVRRCIARLDAYAAERRRPGLLCCAVDTELLGHWWYEGQAWLGGVLEEARAQGLRLVSAGEGALAVDPVERPLEPSSWGARKDFSTWDSPLVAELAFTARGAELRTVAAVARTPERGPALERAARELLALQASDWAFQVTRGLAGDYPLERVAAHAAANCAALEALAHSPPVPADRPPVDPALRNLAPDLDLAPLIAP